MIEKLLNIVKRLKVLKPLISMVDVFNQLSLMDFELKLKESVRERQEMEKKIRMYEKVQKDQGELLTRIDEGEDPEQKKLKQLIEEIRMWKEKVKTQEINIDREEDTSTRKIKKIDELKKENGENELKLEEYKKKFSNYK
jgi:hypothetical protein